MSGRVGGDPPASGGARGFDAVLEEGRGGGALVRVPFDVREVFGSGRPKVRALIDGYEYRGSLAAMGGVHVLGVRKDVRSAIGKAIGDAVRVELSLDTAPREVALPEELRSALIGSPDASARYDGLSYTHRREFAQWVEQAKRPETRERRAARAVEMILEGKTR